MRAAQIKGGIQRTLTVPNEALDAPGTREARR
jgi:hypothetical protein